VNGIENIDRIGTKNTKYESKYEFKKNENSAIGDQQ